MKYLLLTIVSLKSLLQRCLRFYIIHTWKNAVLKYNATNLSQLLEQPSGMSAKEKGVIGTLENCLMELNIKSGIDGKTLTATFYAELLRALYRSTDKSWKKNSTGNSQKGWSQSTTSTVSEMTTDLRTLSYGSGA